MHQRLYRLHEHREKVENKCARMLKIISWREDAGHAGSSSNASAAAFP